MNEENKANVANEETNFSRQVGTQAARKRKAKRGAKKKHLVRPGHVRVDRLVGDEFRP